MEKIIQYLDDIEEKASSIVDRASDEKKQLNATLESDIRAFDNEIIQNRSTKIASLQTAIEKELENELSLLEEDCIKQISEMENNVLNNREVIVYQLFQSIIHN